MAYLEFKDPLLLLLLVPWAAMLAWYLFRQLYNREAAVAISSERIVRVRGSIRAATYRFLPALRFAALLLLIVALSRPGKGVDYSSIKNLGVDIMIAMDVSQSMRAEDFQPKNRLEVSKKVIADFVGLTQTTSLVLIFTRGLPPVPADPEHGMISDLARVGKSAWFVSHRRRHRPVHSAHDGQQGEEPADPARDRRT